MKIDPVALERLKQHVAATFTCNPKTPSDFDMLAADIFRRTGRTIGISTLKRIWGYVSAGHSTSFSSLTVLSRYAGYHDWEVFCERTADEAVLASSTSGFGIDTIIACHTLEIGTELQLRWLPDKWCILRKTGQPDLFRVIKSVNIKLAEGDTGRLNSVQVGVPLVLTACRRGDDPIGTYRGVTRQGLESVAIVE